MNDSAITDALAGLNSSEAEGRLKREGYNELPKAGRRSYLRIVRDVLREPMFILLLVASGLYLILGDLKEAIALVLFAVASIVITVVQEGRSERVLESLRDLTSPRALVIRDGERRRIPGRDVVREDLIVLAEGDRVPADGLILSAHDLLVDESLLTGESVPIGKQAPFAHQTAGAHADDKSALVFSGSLIVRGEAIARVLITGPGTEIGKIGQSLAAIEVAPPKLQTQTRRIVRRFAVASLIVCSGVVLLYGFMRGSWLDALLSGIAVGMSMLPEEFPLVLTVFMVMGAWRISQARVLTRRATAIEALGSATVLCTDKTGTLTENCMTVTTLLSGQTTWNREQDASMSKAIAELARVAILASAPSPSDPMEKAIHDLVGLAKIPESASRLFMHKYGLRPDLFAMTNIWREGSEEVALACAKGAPEAIAELCALAPSERESLLTSANGLAAKGFRVLAVAQGHVPVESLPENQRDIHFALLGLIGLVDPLRSNVPAAVRECHSAGIRVVMITGDYPLTAKVIAAQAGIDATNVMEGDDLAGIADTDLLAAIGSVHVFARVTPSQKLRIVEALKTAGEVVAMTGDGVNDAPALKAANIGIAMGGRGTDVAREASSIVLLDDDFASIVHTIRLGRRIYDNLQKAMEFILAVHVPIAGLALLPLLLNLPLVLWPVHIALLQMLIDPTCSIVFESEPAEPSVMQRPPRPPTSQLLSSMTVLWGILQGMLVLAIVICVYGIAHFRGMPEGEARALIFVSLILCDIALVLANRSFDTSLFAALGGSNRSLIAVIAAVMSVLAIALYVPVARDLFRFGWLSWIDLGIGLVAAIATLIALEAAKSLWRRRVPASA